MKYSTFYIVSVVLTVLLCDGVRGSADEAILVDPSQASIASPSSASSSGASSSDVSSSSSSGSSAASSLASSLATMATVGERILNEIVARTRQGIHSAASTASIGNIITDKNILNGLYRAIVGDDKFAKYVSVDEHDGAYLIDWNNLAADPDAFGEFVKLIKENSIYVRMTESFQQSANTLTNAQLLTNLNRLNDVINKVQNSFRQAISPALDKIKIKL